MPPRRLPLAHPLCLSRSCCWHSCTAPKQHQHHGSPAGDAVLAQDLLAAGPLAALAGGGPGLGVERVAQRGAVALLPGNGLRGGAEEGEGEGEGGAGVSVQRGCEAWALFATS